MKNITSLCLSNCRNCDLLPPLGQLSSLEHLVLENFSVIALIGHEFFRSHVIGCKPFQSLKTLNFDRLPEWEDWELLEEEEAGVLFPCLQGFYLINFPKLVGDLPKFLPSLVKLVISDCPQLAASLLRTPPHCVVMLENCDKVPNRGDYVQSSSTQQDDTRTNPLSSEVPDQQQDQDGTQTQASSSEDGNQMLCPSMDLPTDVFSFRIERYAWNMLPKEILESSSLQHLYLIDCIPLKIFTLPASLKTLFIYNCRTLEFPEHNEPINRLQDLCLGSSCDFLQTFRINYFQKLTSLRLWDCRNLECLSVDKELQNELTSLDALEIKYCPKLRFFFEEDEFRAPNLASLVFFDCGSLVSLQRIQSFESLQSLYINKCPELESIRLEALPSGLIILCISYCDKITPHKGWKLDKLHSLLHFEIEGECQKLETFPEEGLLPRNLNSLRISGLLNLTSLDMEGLQKLTSLQTLEISLCDKLDSLPEHRLPSSLSSLSITDCSLLNPKLRNKRGKEWLKIAHIPSVYLDEDSD